MGNGMLHGKWKTSGQHKRVTCFDRKFAPPEMANMHVEEKV